LSSRIGEGFPNVLGEAMACGVPCVATDVGGSRMIIGESGIVVPPSNAVALGEAIVGVLKRPASERLQLGRVARLRVEEKFSISVVSRAYAELYERAACEMTAAA